MVDSWLPTHPHNTSGLWSVQIILIDDKRLTYKCTVYDILYKLTSVLCHCWSVGRNVIRPLRTQLQSNCRKVDWFKKQVVVVVVDW